MNYHANQLVKPPISEFMFMTTFGIVSSQSVIFNKTRLAFDVLGTSRDNRKGVVELERIQCSGWEHFHCWIDAKENSKSRIATTRNGRTVRGSISLLQIEP